MCWVGCAKTCDGKKDSAELPSGWRGYLDVTGGTNKNQKVPHLDEGVCLLIIIVR